MKTFLRFLVMFSLLGNMGLVSAVAVAMASPQAVASQTVQDFVDHFQVQQIQGLQLKSPHTHGFVWWITPDNYNILIPNAHEVKAYLTPLAIQLDPNNNWIFSSKFQGFIHDTDAFMSAQGFTFDPKNSSQDFNDQKFYDFVHAYQKGEIVCTLTVDPDQLIGPQIPPNSTSMKFGCSNELKKYYDEQLPFLKTNLPDIENSVVTVKARWEEFAVVSVHARRMGYYGILKEQPDGSYEVIFSGQDMPPCSLMEKYGVPSGIYGGQCSEYLYGTMHSSSHPSSFPSQSLSFPSLQFSVTGK